ncbi:LLM class flavin-dependent oxidoreductase [Pseudonocardia sp. CA-107938]|uniref:LLM class flavin-dependent oxidoreductase n=1 Tax=Pseudonocardia sp. CA-107938 TaxID=3240021 RepID=UPI003D8F8319
MPVTDHRLPLGLIEFLDTSAGTVGRTRDRQHRALAGAVLADRIGYRRVWIPEHHGIGSASTNPVPLVAVVGSHTRHIRVGTAVSLVRVRHPHLTAEDLVTCGLFCGDRLDVGLGRGDVAGDAATALAGLHKDDAATRQAVTTVMALLDHGCSWIEPLDTPFQRWMHGARATSAQQAGEAGFDYCHGLFLNPDEDVCRAALTAHRHAHPAGRRAAAIAVVANDDRRRAGADAAVQGGVHISWAGTAAECAAAVVALLQGTDADEVVIAELSRDAADHAAALTAIAGHVAAAGAGLPVAVA